MSVWGLWLLSLLLVPWAESAGGQCGGKEAATSSRDAILILVSISRPPSDGLESIWRAADGAADAVHIYVPPDVTHPLELPKGMDGCVSVFVQERGGMRGRGLESCRSDAASCKGHQIAMDWEGYQVIMEDTIIYPVGCVVHSLSLTAPGISLPYPNPAILPSPPTLHDIHHNALAARADAKRRADGLEADTSRLLYLRSTASTGPSSWHFKAWHGVGAHSPPQA